MKTSTWEVMYHESGLFTDGDAMQYLARIELFSRAAGRSLFRDPTWQHQFRELRRVFFGSG
jgi:hypothetical protein